MPCAASAGASSLRHSSPWIAISSSVRRRSSASACWGVRPSGERTCTRAMTWSSSPATRTMKNSSRLEEKIAQNLTRSSSGSLGSAARSSTRAFRSSQESLTVEQVAGRGRRRAARLVEASGATPAPSSVERSLAIRSMVRGPVSGRWAAACASPRERRFSAAGARFDLPAVAAGGGGPGNYAPADAERGRLLVTSLLALVAGIALIVIAIVYWSVACGLAPELCPRVSGGLDPRAFQAPQRARRVPGRASPSSSSCGSAPGPKRSRQPG